MAFSLILPVALIAVFSCVMIPGSESANFPIGNCFTDEMDVLFLLCDSRPSNNRSFQHALIEDLTRELTSFSWNKRTPRVMFAHVIDRFSALDPQVNVSSWLLHSSPGADPYGHDDKEHKQQGYTNIHETVELKIVFVERLFSEMSGVRENVTHIAVILLDGSGFSYEESRSVPHIVQQQGTAVKIFVVVMYGKTGEYTEYLSDTLLLPMSLFGYSTHALLQAICNACMKGWFMFEHNDVTNSLSCYTLMSSEVPITWIQSMGKCQMKHSYLSAIETTSELQFLHTHLVSYMTELVSHIVNVNQSYLNFSIQVNIGLKRDIMKPARRFQWIVPYQQNFRPLLVNNWMPGKPSGGRSSGCGMWKFIWNDRCSDTCRPETSGRSVNGWIDVDCETQLRSFTLCEIALPGRIEGTSLLRIKPAKYESFSRALAKGDFITFKENIVSISANIMSRGFLEFLKQSGIEFPLFDCGVDEYNPRYVSYVHVCDYIDHCSNKRDEAVCKLNKYQKRIEINEYSINCKGVRCCDGSCLPLQFVNDGEIDCFVCGYGTETEIHDESEIIINFYKRSETCAFICNDDECIRLSQLNDGQTDCLGEEGPLDETIGKQQLVNICYSPLGRSIWSPKCVFVEDKFGAVLGCRDMSHLHNCSDFHCPKGYFKCPTTYCIPQHYVLDGKSDCPAGEDEFVDIISPCSGNFACWNSQICLDPDLVCDGHSDCPYRDDEMDCGRSCPDGFLCISGTVTVSDYNQSNSLKTETFNKIAKYLDFSGIELSASEAVHLCPLHNVVVFILSDCKITDSIADHFSSMSTVRYLDLSRNMITTLDGSYVGYSSLQNVRHLNLSYNRELVLVRHLQLPSLETFDLSHTGLTDVDGSIFGLPNLSHLNLSFTSVTDIQFNGFHTNLILQTLDLRGLTIKNVYADMFNELTVQQHLYTDSFELCCPQVRGSINSHYTCHAPHDAISSCFDLIGVNLQRVLLWAIAVFSVLGNLTVIGYRLIWDRSVLRTGYGLFVTNLGISDFIMGVYMVIIAGADYYYRGIYVLFDKSWRESVVCKLAGFLATLSSETSILFIFLITLDRFLMMKYPFGNMKFTKWSKVVSVLLSWIIGLLLGSVPELFSFEMYSSNVVCLGLPLTTKLAKGWEFSFSVFIVLNCSICLIIAYGQSAIFRAMSENRITNTTTAICPRRAENITIAKQLFLVAMSCILCWFPVGFMGLLSLSGHDIRSDVYAWTTVIVLPITSAANPLLYTIPALLKRWDNCKNGRSTFKNIRS